MGWGQTREYARTFFTMSFDLYIMRRESRISSFLFFKIWLLFSLIFSFHFFFALSFSSWGVLLAYIRGCSFRGFERANLEANERNFFFRMFGGGVLPVETARTVDQPTCFLTSPSSDFCRSPWSPWSPWSHGSSSSVRKCIPSVLMKGPLESENCSSLLVGDEQISNVMSLGNCSWSSRKIIQSARKFRGRQFWKYSYKN